MDTSNCGEDKKRFAQSCVSQRVPFGGASQMLGGVEVLKLVQKSVILYLCQIWMLKGMCIVHDIQQEHIFPFTAFVAFYFVLLHDNAQPQCTAVVTDILREVIITAIE